MEQAIFQPKNKWDKISSTWNNFRSPLRPSVEELRIYDLIIKNQIKKTKNKKVLLLGDSPELRDILAKYNCETLIVANDPDVVFAMNQLTTHIGRKKEKFLVSDWQDMDLGEEKFDIILSDWGLNYLSNWRDYTLVFDKVRNHLHKHGIFVFRSGVYDIKQKIRKIEQIINDYEKDKQNKYNYLLELYLYSDITNYNVNNFEINLNDFYNKNLFKVHMNNIINPECWQELYHPLVNVMTFPEKESIRDLLHKFFDIDDEKYGNDYLSSQNNPIFICQLK